MSIDRDFLDVQFGGGGGGGPSRWVRGHWAWAPGGQRFAQLAAANGVTWQRLHVRSHPLDYRLTTRYLGRPVPPGTRWWVPGHRGISQHAAGRRDTVATGG
jgi:hypothetical protein